MITGFENGDKNMELRIRDYQPLDRPHIVKCMEGLGDYLASIDQMKFSRRMPKYGERLTEELLDKVNRKNGVIYVAEHEGLVIGFIAGIIFEWSEEELLECVPLKSGRILELFIDSNFRGQGVGTMLTEKMERYFRQNGCDVSRVEVFEPNVKAHDFYQKLGYHDRMFDMIKKM
jgi:ribosomal protein S18 acetylase RimI-like enzyme